MVLSHSVIKKVAQNHPLFNCEALWSKIKQNLAENCVKSANFSTLWAKPSKNQQIFQNFIFFKEFQCQVKSEPHQSIRKNSNLTTHPQFHRLPPKTTQTNKQFPWKNDNFKLHKKIN
jgi:hypothetical protein